MWICPSKGRPERLMELAKTWPGETPVFVVLSSDDDKLPQYLETDKWPKNWWFASTDLTGVGNCLNWAFEKHPREKFYGLLGDDVLLRSGHPKELEALAEDWFLAFPADGVHNHGLATHPCLGGDLVRQVGFLAPKEFKHSFIDTFWDNVSRLNGLQRYQPKVRYEHKHPIREPHLMDNTYRLAQSHWADDSAAWQEFVQRKFKNIALDVRLAVQKTFGLEVLRRG